jgi:cytochrome b involved in lipid metabolism
MKNKSKFFLALLIVILVISVTFLIRIKPISSNTIISFQEIKNNSEGTNLSNGVSNKISLTDLSKHDSASDCWVSYKSKVYDITSYLSRHPGSPEKIIPYCGTSTEFENAFTQKHGTSKVSLLMKVGTFIGDFDVI